MGSFDNLYVRSIHFHGQRLGDSKQLWGSGKPTSLPFILHSHTIFALMVIVMRNPTSKEIKERIVVPLQEILRQLPPGFQNGMLSWLILEGEEEPSSIVIHTGIERNELKTFARNRLIRLELDNITKGDIDSQQQGGFSTRKEEREELAAKSTLGTTERIAQYLK